MTRTELATDRVDSARETVRARGAVDDAASEAASADCLYRGGGAGSAEAGELASVGAWSEGSGEKAVVLAMVGGRLGKCRGRGLKGLEEKRGGAMVSPALREARPSTPVPFRTNPLPVTSRARHRRTMLPVFLPPLTIA